MLKSDKVAHNFSRRLDAVMKARGMTIYTLAEAAGVTRASIYSYLEGRRLPRLDYMTCICEVLGVGLDWMVGRKGAKRGASWLPEGDSLGEMRKCSECGTVFRNFGQDKYCRECGAKMDGGEKSG